VRLFVAVELEAGVRAAAAAAGQDLRARLPREVDARWISEERLHITLQFLGDVSDTDVTSVVAALRAPYATRAFSIEVARLGAFPPSGAPRVFWLGVGPGAPGLAALQEEVASRLAPLGYARERRPFSPHLTIARVKEAGGRTDHAAVRQVLAELPAHAGASLVTGVTLFHSRLSPKGASYEPVLRVPLSR
jgi:2'-5' RNA ligase